MGIPLGIGKWLAAAATHTYPVGFGIRTVATIFFLSLPSGVPSTQYHFIVPKNGFLALLQCFAFRHCTFRTHPIMCVTKKCLGFVSTPLPYESFAQAPIENLLWVGAPLWPKCFEKDPAQKGGSRSPKLLGEELAPARHPWLGNRRNPNPGKGTHAGSMRTVSLPGPVPPPSEHPG